MQVQWSNRTDLFWAINDSRVESKLSAGPTNSCQHSENEYGSQSTPFTARHSSLPWEQDMIFVHHL